MNKKQADNILAAIVMIAVLLFVVLIA